MKTAIWFIVAIIAYFISGLNISIGISKRVYKEDIRTQGSHNPGFTNFKRMYGYKYAWIVFLFDVTKGAVTAILADYFFGTVLGPEMAQIGVGFCAIFAMLGHAYPIQYGFKGGKGVLICITMLWALDWRVGIVSLLLLILLLLTVKYMSLSTMLSMALGALMLFGAGNNPIASAMFTLCVVFMIFRHRTNIQRLLNGTESKFSFATKKNIDESKIETKNKEE